MLYRVTQTVCTSNTRVLICVDYFLARNKELIVQYYAVHIYRLPSIGYLQY